ncbi:MAG: Unknown protein [uncultured Thiotrichaceae bacterium]|uniref:PDZ domain-containing protein n=1 Tax=uncultured Thiotrichaceae bacterium TaxID=298394 RepID=A0A6S6U4T4_9GAMM|nr:MAG: Unknown protein [uncultured Thiotrichaceae bacterium]
MRNLILFIAYITYSVAFATNAPQSPATDRQEEQLQTVNVAAYIGMKVDVLSEQLAAQIPDDITVGQGILVTGFGEVSPGKDAGLQENDIIISYNRKPLTHPTVFIKLVREDKPDNMVKLKIVRGGEVSNINVKLGSQEYPLTEKQMEYRQNMLGKGYDGLMVKQFDDDDFSAAIRYLAPDGIVRSHTFKGTYAKIKYDVANANYISVPGRQAIIEAVSERKRKNDGWFGKWIPFNDGNFSPDSFKTFGL